MRAIGVGVGAGGVAVGATDDCAVEAAGLAADDVGGGVCWAQAVAATAISAARTIGCAIPRKSRGPNTAFSFVRE
jgi:hypothetical protein